MTPERVRNWAIWGCALSILMALLIPTVATIEIFRRVFAIYFGWYLTKGVFQLFTSIIRGAVSEISD